MKKILLGLTAVTLLLILSLGLIAWIDPFGWHLLDRFGGDYDAALTAVPPDSTAYMGVNFVNANLDQWRAFQAGERGTAVTDLQTQFETILDDEFGISIHDDMVPWLGQYLGVAILDVTWSDEGVPTHVEWLITAETRDRNASDAFLTTLHDGFAARQNQTAQTISHNGVDITVFDGLAFARFDRLVLAGSSATAVQSALDTQASGQSLADAAGYGDAIAQLPPERFLTFFIPGTQMNDLLSQIPASLLGVGVADLLPTGLQGTAVALQAIPVGVQLDAVTVYDAAQLTAAQKEAIGTISGSSAAADLFPADTIAYFPGQPFATTWAYAREAMVNTLGEADFDESMGLFDDNFGLNPDTDLFPLLTGATAVAIFPTQTDAQFGFAAATATADPAQLSDLVTNFNRMMVESGIGEIATTGGETAVYDFSTFLFPDLALSYALADDYLLLSDRSVNLTPLPTAKETLAETAVYQTTWQSFPDMTPGFFVNVAGLETAVSDLQGENEVLLALLQPLTHVAGAAVSADNSIRHRVILFIE